MAGRAWRLAAIASVVIALGGALGLVWLTEFRDVVRASHEGALDARLNGMRVQAPNGSFAAGAPVRLSSDSSSPPGGARVFPGGGLVLTGSQTRRPVVISLQGATVAPGSLVVGALWRDEAAWATPIPVETVGPTLVARMPGPGHFAFVEMPVDDMARWLVSEAVRRWGDGGSPRCPSGAHSGYLVGSAHAGDDAVRVHMADTGAARTVRLDMCSSELSWMTYTVGGAASDRGTLPGLGAVTRDLVLDGSRGDRLDVSFAYPPDARVLSVAALAMQLLPGGAAAEQESTQADRDAMAATALACPDAAQASPVDLLGCVLGDPGVSRALARLVGSRLAAAGAVSADTALDRYVDMLRSPLLRSGAIAAILDALAAPPGLVDYHYMLSSRFPSPQPRVTLAERKDGNPSQHFVYDVRYPQLAGVPQQDLAFNQLVDDWVSARIAETVTAGPPPPEIEGGPSDNNLDCRTTVALMDARIVSTRVDCTAVRAGGAHPQPLTQTFNWDLKLHQEIHLNDLFSPDGSYLDTLRGLVTAQLEARLGGGFGETDWIAQGTATAQDLATFVITPGGLVIVFQAYQVGPFSVGEPEVTIPYRDLGAIIAPAGPLAGR